VLATNFGVVISDDGGAHFQYSCETITSGGGHLYSLGPAPGNRVYAIANYGAVVTGDLG